MPIQADAKKFLTKLVTKLNGMPLKPNVVWNERCQGWKKNYPVVLPKHYAKAPLANVYCFIKELSKRLPENKITVVGNGSACVVGSHGYEIKKGQRFIINRALLQWGMIYLQQLVLHLQQIKRLYVCQVMARFK
mgnify:CR=1 FL=1